MIKPMWTSEAIKAYESGQGVKLVNIPHPHYEPLPEDLNPESLETVEIDLPEPPQRTWFGLTDEEVRAVIRAGEYDSMEEFARAIEAKLKEKNT